MSGNGGAIGLGDCLILHYRLGTEDGTEISGTFGGEPLTLTLGTGDLAENLEKCLLGLEPQGRHVFYLEPEQAFGISDGSLVQEVPLEEFPPDMPLEENSLIEFTLPNGTGLVGLLKSCSQTHAKVDFNHPLSDCPVVFEVEVLEVLRRT
jgi:FKBP-type peptidyl-prolyl cis-trans isomerase SlpA